MNKNALTQSTDQIINRARSMKPAARAEFLRQHSVSEVFAIHEALLGAAKPKTPRPVMERKILAALAAPVKVAEQPATEAGVEVVAAPIVEPAPDANEAPVDAPAEKPAAEASAQAEEPATDTGVESAVSDTTTTEATTTDVAGATTDTAPNAADAPDVAPTSDAATTDAGTHANDTTSETGADATPPAPATKRGRGRPAKAKPADETRASTPEEMADEAAGLTAKPAGERQLPPVGTVLVKSDRHGVERVRCEIVEGGVLYAGKTYTSLSAAAIAASKDLGNLTKQTSGPKFWGLVQAPARPKTAKALDLSVLSRAWDRYLSTAVGATKVAADDDVAKLREMLLAHSTALFGLATPATTEQP